MLGGQGGAADRIVTGTHGDGAGPVQLQVSNLGLRAVGQLQASDRAGIRSARTRQIQGTAVDSHGTSRQLLGSHVGGGDVSSFDGTLLGAQRQLAASSLREVRGGDVITSLQRTVGILDRTVDRDVLLRGHATALGQVDVSSRHIAGGLDIGGVSGDGADGLSVSTDVTSHIESHVFGVDGGFVGRRRRDGAAVHRSGSSTLAQHVQRGIIADLDLADALIAGIGIVTQGQLGIVGDRGIGFFALRRADEVAAVVKTGKGQAVTDGERIRARSQLGAAEAAGIDNFLIDASQHGLLQLVVGDAAGAALPDAILDLAVHNQFAEAANLGIAHIDDAVVVAIQLARDGGGGDAITKTRELDLAAGGAAEAAVIDRVQRILSVANDQRGAQAVRLDGTAGCRGQSLGIQRAAVSHGQRVVTDVDIRSLHSAFAVDGDVITTSTTKEALVAGASRTGGQVVHLHVGAFSDAERAKAGSGVVEVGVVVVEGQGAVGIALVALRDIGTVAVDNNVGRDASSRGIHLAADLGIATDGDGALAGGARTGRSPQEGSLGHRSFDGVIAGHDILCDGAARDADVEVLDRGRTTVERGAAGIDAAVDLAAIDGQVGGFGHSGGAAVSQATGHDMAVDGAAVDDGVGGGGGGSGPATLSDTATQHGDRAIVDTTVLHASDGAAIDGQVGVGHSGISSALTVIFSNAAAGHAGQDAAMDGDIGVVHSGGGRTPSFLRTGQAAAGHGTVLDIEGLACGTLLTNGDMGAAGDFGRGSLRRTTGHGLAAAEDVLHPPLLVLRVVVLRHRDVGIAGNIGRASGITHGAAADDLGVNEGTAADGDVGRATDIGLIVRGVVLVDKAAADKVAVDCAVGHGQAGIVRDGGAATVDRRATGNDLAVDGAISDGHARAAHSGSGALVIGQTAAHNGSRQLAGVTCHSTGHDRIPSNLAAVDGHGRGAFHGGLGGTILSVGLSDTATDHTGQSALVHGNGAVALDSSSSLRLRAVSCLSLAAANQSAVLDGHVTIDLD